MPVPKLIPSPQPADFDVQNTSLSYDVLGRYICNTWEEIMTAQGSGAYPFDAVVIGGGMFGSYIAEKLYRRGGALAMRILVLEAGAFLLPSHIQHLPQRLGGSVAGSPVSQRVEGTRNALNNAKASVGPDTTITEVAEAPLAVQGSSPESGLLPFDKFSSGPFLIDAIRDDANVNQSLHGDVSRRIFMLPFTQVLRLNKS